MLARKYRNIQAFPRVAVVIGCDDEVTVQCEGTADILTGAERDRCLSTYLKQYPNGRSSGAGCGCARCWGLRLGPDCKRVRAFGGPGVPARGASMSVSLGRSERSDQTRPQTSEARLVEHPAKARQAGQAAT
jgi:hypothetical protein